MNVPVATDLPIAIVGGGYSGTLLAVNLLRHGGRVVLIERSETHLARGLAYGTRRPEHLLNVRAANMSAYPDDAGHFLRWMGFDTDEEANRFVPRLAYGHYLREQLLNALAAAPPGHMRIQTGEACRAEMEADRVILHLSHGIRIEARLLVLASGNQPPACMPEFAGLSGGLFRADPWAADALDGLDDVQDILLLGTGLTAIDIVLALASSAYTGRITALSRRGLVSRAHAEAGPRVPPVSRTEARGSWLLRHVRQRSAEVGWRVAVDELRPHTQSLWRLHDRAAQARFLRHARPWWDVHRHRLAPQVAAHIAQLEAEGRLRFVAGKLCHVAEADGLVHVDWRGRGGDAVEHGVFGRVIGCTGPEGNIARVGDPLLTSLRSQGLIRTDRHGLGLDVDPVCRAIDTNGQAQPRLYAVGPLTRGDAWEIIAVPDIRRQVWDLARRLTDSHWVGGEGL